MVKYTDEQIFSGAITLWLLQKIEKRRTNLSEVEQMSGISDYRTGRKLRAIRDQEQRWTINDLYKIARYFKVDMSLAINQVEFFIKTRFDDIVKVLDGNYI
jgi:hypothetical protein